MNLPNLRLSLLALLVGGFIGATLRLFLQHLDWAAHWERLAGLILLFTLSAVTVRMAHGLRSWACHFGLQLLLLCLWGGFLGGWWMSRGYAWADFGATSFIMFWPVCAGLGLLFMGGISYREKLRTSGKAQPNA